MTDSLADRLAERLARGEPWVMEDWPDGTPANDRPLVEEAVEALREKDAEIEALRLDLIIAKKQHPIFKLGGTDD